MTPFRYFSKFPSIKRSLTKGVLVCTVAGGLGLYTACSGGSTEYVSETKLEPTQGLVTTVEEVRKDAFKIADETIVDKKEDSRIIAQYLDGEVDTFTLDQVKLMEKNGSPRMSGMSGILMGGAMGYLMGKSMSKPLNSSAYKNNAAFNKSTGSTQKMAQTAKKTTTRRPARAKSNFGSRSSTRSFGG